MQTHTNVLMAWLVAMITLLFPIFGEAQTITLKTSRDWLPNTLTIPEEDFFEKEVDGEIKLFSKHHFNPPLIDEATGEDLSREVEGVILLVSGWNVARVADQYGFEFAELTERLKLLLSLNTEDKWSVVQYHWEKDSATGNTSKKGPTPFFTAATEAAAVGYLHGESLATQLAQYPNLHTVQFITHGAGVWLGYHALEKMIATGKVKRFEFTMLDPFIPGDIPDNNIPFTSDRLGALVNHGEKVALRHYYSPFGWKPLQESFDLKVPDKLIAHTVGKEFAGWPRGSQLQVSIPHTGIAGAPTGSIQFYSQAVQRGYHRLQALRRQLNR